MINSNIIEDYVKNLLEEYNLKCEKLSKDQLAEVIIQIILSGDIFKYTTLSHVDNIDNTLGHYEGIVYIPFQQVTNLKFKVERLEEALNKISKITNDNLIAEIIEDVFHPEKSWVYD